MGQCWSFFCENEDNRPSSAWELSHRPAADDGAFQDSDESSPRRRQGALGGDPVLSPPRPIPEIERDQERQRAELRRRMRCTLTPCIANGTWRADKNWRVFRRKFIVRPRDCSLQPGESEGCPACLCPWGGEVETDHPVVPVRLPCNAQHVMCQWCARRWFKRGTATQSGENKCPHCRQILFKNTGPDTFEQYQQQQQQMF